mmetsp:Transcript_3670/g.7625  ORF Transcript_3670/g.7625 Transcript_3670/m.7625 type:complete len:330 (+) Transcript_3670:61-1050(+)
MVMMRKTPVALLLSITALFAHPTSTHASASAAVSSLKSVLSDIDPRFFVAGGICAATSHGITCPIDVVKTRVQADPEKFKGKSLMDSTKLVVNEGGPLVLLSGLGPTVAGYGIEGAMKFGVYEIMKPITMKALGSENKAVAYLVASIVAGAVASLILCPMESARIKVVTDPSYAGMGLFQSLSRVFREDGFVKIFSGVYAMLAKQVPYTIFKQVSFDVFATLFYALAAKAAMSKKDSKMIVPVSAAAVASVLACLSSQPGDMVLTETYRSKTDRGVWGILGDIYQKDGPGGFFVGTKARLVHVCSIITSQLVIYDIVKQHLGLPATGSH